MSPRRDREDLTRQRAAVDEARAALARAASDLAGDLAVVVKAAKSNAKNSPLTRQVVESPDAGWLAFDRAREALWLAELDLRTAQGEDL